MSEEELVNTLEHLAMLYWYNASRSHQSKLTLSVYRYIVTWSQREV
jgi:hypothetical protein